MKRDGPKASTCIYGHSGIKFLPEEKANVFANIFENQFAPHDLCDEHHEDRMEACVQALFETKDRTPPPQK
jgi:hypothetical protein